MYENICAQRGLILMLLAMLLGCPVVSGQDSRRNNLSKEKSAPRLEQTDKAWLAPAEISRDSVTNALNAVNALSATDAGALAASYRAAKDQASMDGKHAAALLVAVALERANEASAVIAYNSVVSEAANTPYGTSAAFRVEILEQAKSTPADADKLYTKIAADPEAEGWFRSSDQWRFSTTRRAAWQALVDLRSNYLSFRIFSFIREKSFFPRHLAFLFVLLTLAIGAKLVSLPFYIKTARFMGRYQKLQPEIRRLGETYSGTELQSRINELYSANGVSPFSGCAVFLLDCIFVIWALYSLRSFRPQISLDDSSFWWIADVTQRDYRIILAYAGCSLVSMVITARWQAQSASELGGGSIFSNAIIFGIAWYWHWPAYIFIFWAVLILIGIVFHVLLTPVRIAAAS